MNGRLPSVDEIARLLANSDLAGILIQERPAEYELDDLLPHVQSRYRAMAQAVLDLWRRWDETQTGE
jgi:hypothetical protein